MNEQELILSTIGDLEINRRALVLEVQRLNEQIEQYEKILAERNGDLPEPVPIPEQ